MNLSGCGLFPPFLSLSVFLLLMPVLALAALLVDRMLAEPRRFHPLVAFGRWAQWLEKRLNRPGHPPAVVRGILALLLALSPLLLIWAVNAWLASVSWWGWLLWQVLLLYSCIGWQSLQQHVLAVYEALTRGDSVAARDKLSWIVSRDTQQLDDDEVAQAGIESLLENSSDALFVSLFWFALGGAVLALAHRWVNTLDAMWGYKNPRFLYFGRAAARLDDLLAFWPSRLTALCFVAAAGDNGRRAWRCWRRQAAACSSPNGGPVMTSGAGALNVRLSERACYHGEWAGKPPMGCGDAARAADIPRAVRLVKRALWVCFIFWLLAVVLIAVVLR